MGNKMHTPLSSTQLAESAASQRRDDSSPWIPFEDRRRARDEKRDAVLRTAVQMFLEDGYHHTSLVDVAKRLNITKPALYNYFESKEDILRECYRIGLKLYEDGLHASHSDECNGIERLRALIRAYAHVISTDFGRCVVRLDDREFKAETHDQVRQTKRRIEQAFRDAILLGTRDGSIAPCEPSLTSFAITGALNGIGAWFDPNGAFKAEEVAESYARQLTAGLDTASQIK